MNSGDIAYYWPKWQPSDRNATPSSHPEGICVILGFDPDEDAHLEGKPGFPQWHILFEGRECWVATWQVQEIS